jgi:hypothetical protein
MEGPPCDFRLLPLAAGDVIAPVVGGSTSPGLSPGVLVVFIPRRLRRRDVGGI